VIPRRVPLRQGKPLTAKTIRQLKAGEELPPGEPRRYVSGRGYIRLRWRLGDGSYVEVYEHRVIDGRVTTAEQVHHKNRNRSDNRPQNLEHLSAEAHSAEHHHEAHERRERVVSLDADGLNDPAADLPTGLRGDELMTALVPTLERLITAAHALDGDAVAAALAEAGRLAGSRVAGVTHLAVLAAGACSEDHNPAAALGWTLAPGAYQTLRHTTDALTASLRAGMSTGAAGRQNGDAA
jgi:HNH endonuclease